MCSVQPREERETKVYLLPLGGGRERTRCGQCRRQRNNAKRDSISGGFKKAVFFSFAGMQLFLSCQHFYLLFFPQRPSPLPPPPPPRPPPPRSSSAPASAVAPAPTSTTPSRSSNYATWTRTRSTWLPSWSWLCTQSWPSSPPSAPPSPGGWRTPSTRGRRRRRGWRASSPGRWTWRWRRRRAPSGTPWTGSGGEEGGGRGAGSFTRERIRYITSSITTNSSAAGGSLRNITTGTGTEDKLLL